MTPADQGALDVLMKALTTLGFNCHRLQFGDGDAAVHNLYVTRRGTAGRNFCFAGHTDVVPVGDGWTLDPFNAEVVDGMLYADAAPPT